jgi:hypothetical protein
MYIPAKPAPTTTTSTSEERKLSRGPSELMGEEELIHTAYSDQSLTT